MTQIEHIEPKPKLTPLVMHDMLLKDLTDTKLDDLLKMCNINTHIVEHGSAVINKGLGYKRVVTQNMPAILHDEATNSWTLYVTKLWLETLSNSLPVVAVLLIPYLEAFIQSKQTDDLLANPALKSMMDKFGLNAKDLTGAQVTFG